MSKPGLDALRARVHGDPDLVHKLHVLEAERFTGEVAALAARPYAPCGRAAVTP